MTDKEKGYIDPLDLLDIDDDLEVHEEKQVQQKKTQHALKQGKPKRAKAVFVTGTDTHVGKTVATAVLGTLFKDKGWDVGIMKPVQCGGKDAQFLRELLEVNDPLEEINPYHAKEALSPQLAFERAKTSVKISRIKDLFEKLRQRHDILIVEGAGGLCVPIKPNVFVSDLIRELDIEVVIVSRLGLGTINHTLLTVRQAQAEGLNVKGVLFTADQSRPKGIPEKTNPTAVKRWSGVRVLGEIPHLKTVTAAQIKKVCAGKISLNALTEEKRNPAHRQLTEADKKYVWHPFTQMKDWLQNEPLVIDSARGSRLKDTQGQEYIDGVSSLWVNVHGHRHPMIDRAIIEQVGKVSHSTMLGLTNTPAVQLAETLAHITPEGLNKVFFSDNGSTAVEVAIKQAYQYWQNKGETNRKTIAHLAQSYHGDTLGSVSVGGISLFHKVYQHLTFPTLEIPFPDCYRAPEGKVYPDYAFECLEEMDRMFEQHAGQVAALVVEPMVQGAAGMIVWPQGVLKKTEEICRKHKVLLIADEVATGFGRTGKMFACEHENVRPDFLCLAKGLTGGTLPLAATLTTQEVFDGFCFDHKEQKTFFHGHTYTGNPLGCAAALANIRVFQKEQTLARLQKKITSLSARLEKFKSLKHAGNVRQQGFMAGIELVRDKETKDPYPWEEQMGVKVCALARRKHVILRPLGNVIVLMPPLGIDMQDLDRLLDVTYWAIRVATENIEIRRRPYRRRPRRPSGRRRNRGPSRPPSNENAAKAGPQDKPQAAAPKENQDDQQKE